MRSFLENVFPFINGFGQSTEKSVETPFVENFGPTKIGKVSVITQCGMSPKLKSKEGSD